MSNRPVRIQKRLLQFNQIPFAFGEITGPAYTVSFKGESQPYTNNAHGSYFPTLGESGILESSTFRASFDIDFRKLGCEDKVRYARFIKRELAKSGKLWAVQNATELLWTNARVTDIIEEVDDPGTKDMFRFSVTFELIDGYWRLAKRTRTFLCEYCPNRFEDFDTQYCNDLYDYYGLCDSDGRVCGLPCNYSIDTKGDYEGCKWKPLCFFPLYNDRITKDENGMPLYVPSLYNMFGVNCSNQYYIRYDCDLEKSWFCHDGWWGRKWRLDTKAEINTTPITFCSRTDLPTDKVRVRLVGKFINPSVTINGDTLTIPTPENSDGMDGAITIGYGTEVLYSRNKRDPFDNAQDISYLCQRTNTPMFELQAGSNSAIVKGNVFGKDAQVYIDSVDITW